MSRHAPVAAPAGLSLHDALHALAAAICRARPAVSASGAGTSALYLDAAAGSVRHAVHHLGRGRGAAVPGEAERILGKSRLRIRSDLPVRALSCRHAVEERVDAVCVLPAGALPDCVWVRRSGLGGWLGVRGRVAERRGELWFLDDERAAAAPGASPVVRSLAVDLVTSGELVAIAGDPAEAALLAQSLGDGSWLHLPSGTRWFTDGRSARALVAAVAPTHPPSARPDLAGIIDKGILARIEALGWRHVPTPALRGI